MTRAKFLSFHVVPTTAGQGIISDFSETVCAIFQFLGIAAEVTAKYDTEGIALAFERGADAIFMADDHRFVGLNLHSRSVVDNAEATGRVYSGALDLMAGGLQDRDVLVLGCGPVGAAATHSLLSFGARVVLHDLSYPAALSVLKRFKGKSNIAIEQDLLKALTKYRFVVDATPSGKIIPDDRISGDSFVAAPGVPLGISKKGRMLLKHHLIHDKLELGVTAMAVSLLCQGHCSPIPLYPGKPDQPVR